MIHVIIIYYGRDSQSSKASNLTVLHCPLHTHTYTHQETQTHILNVTLWNNLPLDILNGLGRCQSRVYVN